MQCPKCQIENPENKKFCRECGSDLILACPKCSSGILPSDKFCGACRYDLRAASSAVSEKPPDQKPHEEKKPLPPSDSARKYVTVLFSDMSGYTAMTEKLDPEETKEIMGKIFGEISKVVAKYEGFIEKFIGDAVMALFGVPIAHEDDPVRAIKAAREIHEIVSSISPQYEKKIGNPLAMHTGICTGLVVTGEVNLEKGIPGVLGDTINTAARLTGLAQPGEIVIGPDTYHQAEGYFTFEPMEPTSVKGKAEPIRPYKVLSAKEDPTTIHRLSGMRADLIGRKVEMAQLQEALINLRQGKGSIFSIVGDAGTGKSRLIEDFKASINLEEIQWREGHAYAYSQNIPYFPLIDLFSRAWQITEGDNPEQVKKKVETGAGYLIGERNDLIPYIGSLYSIKYPEIENVSPEYWKLKLREAVQLILSALTHRAHTIICIEDLHWADPSSVELLRNILSDFRYPAIFLCIYRPTFSLFTSHQANIVRSYHEINIHDLSPGESQDMVESLLKSKNVPIELKKFIQTKIEGNPFYLEEVINSLLETSTLIQQADQWLLTKPLTEANIPATIQGVIAARVDGLERDMKRIIQEASVIGRAFLYEILKRVTELRDVIDKSLGSLERLELIRTRTIQPDLEYIFKHAITQEVVYNGLLKKERQALHERIGFIMEQLFNDRLPEYYETLAFHYKQGQSTSKAVDYLIKCGEKSLNRYSLEEAHRYFQEAFDILSNKADRSKEDDKLIIDLLSKWLLVYYFYGDWKGLETMLNEHKGLAESLNDKARLGMFYACLGFVLFFRLRLRESYDYLRQALLLGEEANDKHVIGYAATWQVFTCNFLGLIEQSMQSGKKAFEIQEQFPADHYLFFKPWAGVGQTYYFKGEGKKCLEIGQTLLEYGVKHSNVRAMTAGYIAMANGCSASGDFSSAIRFGQKGSQVAMDRFYSLWARYFLGMDYVQNEQFDEAEVILQDIIAYGDDFGGEGFGIPGRLFLGVILVAKGHMDRGLKMIEMARQTFLKCGWKFAYSLAEYILGRIYLQIVKGAAPMGISTISKNIGFLVKNVPFAAKKAEEHLTKAIEVAKEIGAKGILAQASLDMGRLHQTKGRTEEARSYITDAIQLFEECEADVFLKQAKEVLASL